MRVFLGWLAIALAGWLALTVVVALAVGLVYLVLRVRLVYVVVAAAIGALFALAALLDGSAARDAARRRREALRVVNGGR